MDHDAVFPNDPRSLSLAQRLAWGKRLCDAQRHWLDRLRLLAEAPPEADSPAFLLATPPFAPLVRAIGDARRRADLTTAAADALDRFTDAFRDYLRTCAGEDAFHGGPTRRAG